MQDRQKSSRPPSVGDGGRFNTRGQKFLRGYQVTDAEGRAEFLTIYPGWYEGRTVHIHFKIRTDPDSPRGQEFTSQLYFEDSLSDQIATQAPYTDNRNRRTPNDRTRIARTRRSRDRRVGAAARRTRTGLPRHLRRVIGDGNPARHRDAFAHYRAGDPDSYNHS